MKQKSDRFRDAVRQWGKSNLKNYPWRYQSDPYRVIVSEFMLQRTRTEQVLPIYSEFMDTYPTLEDFYKEDVNRIRALLYPLGLNWRIDAMINALSEMWKKHGKVPDNYDLLRNIRGIGQYIAGATICFTYNFPIILIDSNIVRVTGRVFGLDLTGEARRKKPVIETINNSYDRENSRDYYYCIIDLAHTFCKPSRPLCVECPLFDVPCSYTTISKYQPNTEDHE